MAKRTRVPARQRRASDKARQRRASDKARQRGADDKAREKRASAKARYRRTPRKARRATPGVRKNSPAGKNSRRPRLSSDTGKSPPGSARRISYTPELLAAVRHRYEHTEESITSITIELGIHKTTLYRMAARLGWTRYVPPPRDLPPAVRLLAQATALKNAVLAGECQLPYEGKDASHGGQPQDNGADQSAENQTTTALPLPAATIERLIRAALEELTAVETLRRQLKRRPHTALEGERTARTISNLTQTINTLHSLQYGDPQYRQDHDEIPRDLDEFRNELARRIDAFVQSRADEGGAEGDGAVAVDQVQR